MSVLGLKSGYTVKYGLSHILPHIPPLVLIGIKYIDLDMFYIELNLYSGPSHGKSHSHTNYLI